MVFGARAVSMLIMFLLAASLLGRITRVVESGIVYFIVAMLVPMLLAVPFASAYIALRERPKALRFATIINKTCLFLLVAALFGTIAFSGFDSVVLLLPICLLCGAAFVLNILALQRQKIARRSEKASA